MIISKYALDRMPAYLAYLKSLPPDTHTYISASMVAAALGMGPVQVRKDLAAVSKGGRPRTGFLRQQLIEDIEQFLGFHNCTNAVLVGAGKLGRALMEYQGFKECGLNILAAFDIVPDTEVAGEGITILPVSQLTDFCRDHNIRMGIITVPPQHAQAAAEHLITSGIQAIWNFAPVRLEVPDNIFVQYENMADSLAILSVHLRSQIRCKTNDA